MLCVYSRFNSQHEEDEETDSENVFVMLIDNDPNQMYFSASLLLWPIRHILANWISFTAEPLVFVVIEFRLALAVYQKSVDR